jgi:TATA-binding protein-associated factor
VLPRDSSDDPSKDLKRKSGGQGFKSILSGLGEL